MAPTPADGPGRRRPWGRWLANVLVSALLLELTVRLPFAVGLVRVAPLGDARHPFPPPVVPGTVMSLEARVTHDPVRGWRNTPGRHAGPGHFLHVDALGRRQTTAAPDGAPRVVVLGDSYTFGAEVPDEEVWVQRVARAWPDVAFDNLAVPAYGQDQMLLTLRERLTDDPPDIAILASVYLDTERNEFDHYFLPKPRFLLRDGALVLDDVPVPTRADVLALERWRPRLWTLAHVAWLHTQPFQTYEARLALSEALQRAFAEEARAAGVLPVMLALPSRHPTDPDDLWHEATCPADLGLCWSAYPAFEGAGPEVVEPGGHWTADGHARVARWVQERLPEALATLPSGERSDPPSDVP